MRVLLLVVVSLGASIPLGATDYYIASGGTGPWSPSSKTTPMSLATLEANYASFVAGDTYHFAAGTFTLTSTQIIQPTVSGTASAPITFVGGDTTITGASGTTTTIDGNNVATSCFWLTSVSWYVVTGFMCKNVVIGGAFPTGAVMAIGTATAGTSANNVFQNCDISNGGLGVVLASATDNRVTGCTIHDNNVSGLTLSFRGSAFWNGTNSRNRFDHNTYYNEQKEGHNDSAVSGTGSVDLSEIFNDVFYNNETGGAGTGQLYVNGTNATLRNNICWNNSSSTAAAYASLYVGSAATATISEKFDDLYAPASGAILVQWNTTSYTTLASYNTAQTPNGSNDVNADPLFVSTAGNDFHLLSINGYVNNAGTWQTGASGSPCIDAGDNATSTTASAAIAAGAATITVASTTGFPTAGLVITEGNTIAYTGTTATTFTGCTGAAAHASGVTVYAAYSDWSQETQDHGSRIDMGAQGDTINNSRSGAVATNNWTGAFSTSWALGGNWYHMTPTNTNDRFGVAQIPSAANNPQLNTAGTCYSLTVTTGTLNLSDATAHTLTIGGGAMSVSATGTVSVSGTSSTTISGSVTNSGTISQSGGTLVFAGAFTNSSTFSQTAGTLQFAGASSQTFTVNTAPTLSGTLSVNLGAGATLSLAGTAASLTATTLSLESTNGGSFEVTPASGPAVTVSGATTIAGGTLLFDQTGSTTLSGAVSVTGGTMKLAGGATAPTVNLNGPTGPQLTIAAGGTLVSVGGAVEPTLTTGGAAMSILINGTIDINGLAIQKTDLVGGAEAFQIEDAATITNFNDVRFSSYVKGVFIKKLSGTFAFRTFQFNAFAAGAGPYNVKRLAGSGATFNMENATGSTAGETYEMDPTGPNPTGIINWVTFKWKWVGGFGTNQWNDVPAGTDPVTLAQKNWVWTGAGTAPNPYPNAPSEALSVNYDVYVASTTNTCTLNGSFAVGNMTIGPGATLISLAGGQNLTMYATAYKSSGGTFTANDGTVTFAGGAAQTVIIIGSSGNFNNLTINKTAGTTAQLGASLPVNSTTTVTAGTFELSNYTLTQNGALTVSAGATLSMTGTGGIVRTGTPATALTNNGTVTTSSSALLDWSAGTGVVTQAAGATLTIGSTSAIIVGTGTNNLNGTVTLSSSGTLRIPDTGTVNIQGTLNSSGTAPTITKTVSGSGGFTFNVVGGATLNVSLLNFSYAGLNGFTIDDSGASSVTITALNNVAFANVTGAPLATDPGARRRHLYIKGTLGAANVTLSGCSFDSTFLNGGTNDGYNIVTEWTPSTVSITLSQYGGAGSGPETLTIRDYDNSELGTLAKVVWARTLNWNGKWQFRQPLTITANASGIAANEWVSYTFSHAALVTAGQSLGTGDDVRVVYAPPGVTATEVSRVIYNPLNAATNLWNQASTTIEFQVQAAIAASGSDSNYYLYYGASAADAANPPLPTNGINAGKQASGTQLPNTGVYGILLLYDGFEQATIDATKWPTRDADTNGNKTPIVVPGGTTGTAGTGGVYSSWIGSGNTLGSNFLQCLNLDTTVMTNVTIRYARAVTQKGGGGVPALNLTVITQNNATTISTLESLTPTTAVGIQWAAVTFAPTAVTGGTGGANGTSGLTLLNLRFNQAKKFTTEFSYTDEVYIVSFNLPSAGLSSVTAGAAATITGSWTDPYNWQPSGTTTSYAVPTSTDDVVINSKTYAPTLSSAGTCFGLKLSPTSGTTLTLGSGATLTTAGLATVYSGGTLSLGSGTTLTMANNQTLTVNSGGTLSTSGTSASSRATINAASGSYAFSLAGTMNVNWLKIAGLKGSGLVVQSTATLTGWTGVWFTSGTAGGVHVDFSGATSSTTLPSTMSLCTFDASSATTLSQAASAGAGTLTVVSTTGFAASGTVYCEDDAIAYTGTTATSFTGCTGVNSAHSSGIGVSAGPAYNVKGGGTGATQTRVTFLNWAGVLGGRPYTGKDPLDLIVWGSGGAVVNVTQSKKYATIYDALSNTASGDLVEVRDNAIRIESIDINTLANKKFTLDGAVLQAPSGTFAVKGTGPAVGTTNEILQNCVLISNGAAVVQDVGQMYHCDVLGTDLPLLSVAVGKTTTIQNCIVGNATSWTGTAALTVSSPGTFTSTYCDFNAGVLSAPYIGAGNINGSPSFVKFAPSSGMYDVHLSTGSPCIDAAIAAPGPVTTTFDRGSDIINDANNLRRPLYPTAPPLPAQSYDMGAEEYAPYLVGGAGTKPYGVPYWTSQTGPAAGTTPGANSDVIPNFDFADFVFFTGNNVNTSASAAGNQDLLALYMGDGGGAGGTVRATFTTGAQYSNARKIVHITATRDAAGGTDSVYCVVNTDNVGSDGDGVVALTYNGTSFSPKAGWSSTTPALMTTGSGTMGSVVVDGNGDLFVVKGRLLYHLSGSTGAAYVSGASPNYWAGDGHNNYYTIAGGGSSDAIYDPNGGMFADQINNIVQVPLMGHPTDQIWLILRDSGLAQNVKDTGTQAGFRKNHTGFNQIGGRVYLTPTQTDFVVALASNNLTPVAAWGAGSGDSVDLGAQVTTRAATLTRNDADVRVGAGNNIYKLLKSNGTLATDSAAGTDWGNSRSLRGNISTTPFIVGFKDLTGVAGDDAANDRGSKMFFGTDQGYCYVLSYIRNITGAAAGDITGDSQPSWTTDTSTYLVVDGRPYPGYPYRLPGVRVLQVTQGYSASISRNLLVFVCDNGWIYAFPEPY